jgi:cytochrome c oxidase subunit 4
MSEHSVEEINQHVKKYIKVFVALLILTGVTVAASYLNVTVAVAIGIGLLIALFKGTLVAGYFMHLFGEKKIIYWILLLMLIFFVVLLFLPVLTASHVVGY